MTEWVQQQICIKICIKFEHSSVKTVQMIQKGATMGNWWLAASSQCTCSCITYHVEFFAEISNHPGDSAPLQPRFGVLWLLVFPKLKSPLKGERFRTFDGIQKNMTRQLMATRRTMWGPRHLFWRGLRCHFPMYNVSCIFNKCLYFFILCEWILSGQTSYMKDPWTWTMYRDWLWKWWAGWVGGQREKIGTTV